MECNIDTLGRRIRNQLRALPLFTKFLFLVLGGILFFGLILFIKKDHLLGYSCIIMFLLVLMGVITRLVVGRRLFRFTMGMWVVGYIAYLVFMIPYTLTDFPISPFMVLDDSFSRWLYVLGYPFRILGTFFTGSIFIGISSPVEFLRFGAAGLYIAFLFRTVEYTKEILWENIDALHMQGKWPEESRGILRFREAWLKIKYSPILIGITFRNIVCWALPWAWLSFTRIQRSLKGE